MGAQENKTDYKIYPNPSKGLLKVEFRGSIHSVKIYDSSGKKVFDSKVEEQSSEILLNLEDLKSGLYSIQLIGGQRIYSEIFIISH